MTTERELKEQEEQIYKSLKEENTPQPMKQSLIIIGVCLVIIVASVVLLG